MRAVERNWRAGWLFLFLVLASWIAQARAAGPLLAGREVDVAFVDEATQEPRPAPGVAWRVDVQATALRAGASPVELLVANRIVPDSEAFTLLYELNPGILDFKALDAGASVRVPCLVGPDAKPLDPGRGVMLQVTVDGEIRQALLARIGDVQRAAEAFADVAPDRFSSPAQATKAKEQVAVLRKWFGEIGKRFIHRTAPPLRRASLVQLRDEASALQGLLRGSEASAARFGDADARRLAGIYADVELEIPQFSQVLANQVPKGERQVVVRVNLRGTDASTLASLRVYYTINGLFQDPPTDPPVPTYAFRQLGSGMAESLPIKNYRVWAARDGQAGHPLSPPLLVQVSPLNGDMQVDLDVASTR